MKLIVFFFVFMAVVGTAAYYTAARLTAVTRLRKWQKWMVQTGVVFSICSVPVAISLRRFGFENAFMDIVTWLGYIGLGFFSFIFTFLVCKDAGLLILRCYKGVRGRYRKIRGKDMDAVRQTDLSRRRFLAHSTHTGIVAAAGLFTGVGYANATQLPDLKQVTIPIAGLPTDLDGFRILQLTDIHVSPTIKRPFVEAVVERANRAAPDLIALTGDLVDGSVPRLKQDVAPLVDLQAPFGKFFVTGNHEYYSGVYAWLAHLPSLGFQLLLNQHHLVQKGAGRLLVAGVTDYRGSRFDANHRSDPVKALQGAPDAHYKILLAHQPKSIFQASRAGFDLQISGHTHGGQFFPWNLLVGLAQPYTVGLQQYNRTLIYVSRGTGYWGPPLRLGSPSEITVIRLARKPGI